MRSSRLAARLDFAERFTSAVIERPFLAALRRVSALPLALERLTATTVTATLHAPRAPDMPYAA